VKIFIRSDAASGFMNQFEIYLGKSAANNSTNGAYFDVVKRLTDPVLNKYHKIFFDNAYTSVPLLIHLLQNNTYACGTVRVNRKFFPEALRNDNNMERGEFVVLQDATNNHLTATMWKDTKTVRFLSTCTDPRKSTKTIRRIGGVRTEVTQPSAGAAYSRNMGGVDRFDQLRGFHKVGRTAKKAWKYIFYFLMNSCVVNSWILYKSFSTRGVRNYSHMRFRHELALSLMADQMARKRAHDTAATGAKHKNVRLTFKRPRRCKMHRLYSTDGRKVYETVYGCKACNISLCHSCHVMYHTAKR
jgi:hypothetical protein